MPLSGSRSPRSILLVEDNPGDQRLFEELLAEGELDVDVRTASSLREGIRALREDPPDLAVVDLGLPDSQGPETVRRITEAAPRVPVVVLTGQDPAESGPAAVRAGAQDYLHKDGITARGLVRTLRYAMLRVRASEEIRRRERRFSAVLAHVSDVISVVSREGTVRFVSPSASRVTGYPAEQLEGTNILEKFHEEDRDRVARALAELAEGASDERVVRGRFRHADGSWRVLENRGRRPPADTGIEGVLVVSNDVTDEERQAAEIEEQRERLERVLETSADGLILFDGEGNFTYANPAAEEMLGLEKASIAERTYNDPRWAITDPHGGPFPDEELPVARVLSTGEPVRHVEHAVERPDGTRRILSVNAAPLRDGEGAIRGGVASLRDVTRQRETEQQMRLLATAVSTMRTGVLITGPNLEPPGPKIQYVNQAMTKITGYSREELIGETPRLLQGPATDRRETDRLKRVLSKGRVFEGETVNYRKDGTPYHLRWQVTPLRDDDGEITHFVSVQEDVTERKRAEEQLRYQALHDPLTGLANRTLLQDRLKQGLSRMARRDRHLGVLMLDIVQFKRINDRLGHTAGDRVLTAFGRRLEESMRDEDTVGRWGGDEFVLLFPDFDGLSGLRAAWKRIEKTLTRPLDVAGEIVQVDVRGGAVLCGEGEASGSVESEDPEEILRFADLALQASRERNTPGLEIFDPSEKVEGAAHMAREKRLREAIERGQIVPYFQPIVNLETGEYAAVEVLARWQHPDAGVLTPAAFIPLARDLGLLPALGETVIRRACRDAVGWTSDTFPHAPKRLTFNLSADQFQDPRLPERIAGWLTDAGLPAERVIVEVTESSVMRNAGNVERLRESGVQVFLDDFGTGYSTLKYLRDLEIDGLKIGMTFVQRIAQSEADEALVETVLGLGRKLQLTVVAEGIETDEQLEKLRDMGCGYGQGFLFARPVPSDQVAGLLKEAS